MSLVEFYFEYYDHGVAGKTEKAWLNDSEYITDLRPAMKNQNLYRCWLSSGREVVKVEDTIITLEVY